MVLSVFRFSCIWIQLSLIDVLGNWLTTIKVMHEVTTITPIKVENPEAFTIGPIIQTAKELTPKDTANRIPETRERIVSSTKRTIMASVKGIAPKMAAINNNCAA